jgi:hypothetical protein
MDIPIRFPNHYDVIYEDAARFRALAAEDRVRALEDCFRLACFLRTVSGRQEQRDAFAEEQRRLEWKAIQEFAVRHG